MSNNINGFLLKEERYIQECNSDGYLYEHEKTGAKLVFLKNDDKEKVFSIAFRTVPTDDSGVAHIIEHSVLCGSKKYNVKEPFVELLKGSLNTFLNAMTFPDKTIYPFASKNEKDFMNILDIYMDAVFNPNIYQNKNIFLQEGWHYELENKDADLSVKGVVHSEMKGVYSAPNSLLDYLTNKVLYSNTYGKSSGGYPDEIPNLSYEGFIKFHKKHYHPSNAVLYLYGDCDLNKVTKHVNEEFLSKYDKLEPIQIDATIIKDKQQILTGNYPLPKGQDESNKSFMMFKYVLPESISKIDKMGIEILIDLLFNSNASIVKNMLLSQKMCGNISAAFNTMIKEPFISITVFAADKSKTEDIKSSIYTVLNQIVSQGFDKNHLMAFLSSYEFKMREANAGKMPKGVLYSLSTSYNWTHNKDILDSLEYNEALYELEDNIETTYYEDLLKKYILNNNFSVIYTLNPKVGLLEEDMIKSMTSLKEYKESLDDIKLQEVIEETRNLKLHQSTPNTTEELDSIPKLKKDDINKKSEVKYVEEKEVNGIKTYQYETYTNEITYVDCMFDISCISKQDLPYVSILTNLLGKIDTKNHNFMELSMEIMKNTGGIYSYCNIFDYESAEDKIKPYLSVALKTKTINVESSFELLNEVVTQSVFTNKNYIRQLLGMFLANFKMSMMQGGNKFAASRNLSYTSVVNNYCEKLYGYDLFVFIQDLFADFDNKFDGLVAKLDELFAKIFNKSNMVVAYAGEDEEVEAVEDNLMILIKDIPDNKYDKVNYDFEKDIKNEAFSTESNVNYVSIGCKVDKEYKYSGKLEVVKSILTTDYLWNKVRVLGGAYGVKVEIYKDGDITITSYRDPNIDKTLETYRNIPNYLNDFNVDEVTMNKYIIGAIKNIDVLSKPDEGLRVAFSNFIEGVTPKKQQIYRDEILNTSVEDIRSFSDMFKYIVDKNSICAVCNANKLVECKKSFKTIL